MRDARNARSEPNAISQAQTKRYKELSPEEKAARVGYSSDMPPSSLIPPRLTEVGVPERAVALLLLGGIVEMPWQLT